MNRNITVYKTENIASFVWIELCFIVTHLASLLLVGKFDAQTNFYFWQIEFRQQKSDVEQQTKKEKIVYTEKKSNYQMDRLHCMRIEEMMQNVEKIMFSHARFCYPYGSDCSQNTQYTFECRHKHTNTQTNFQMLSNEQRMDYNYPQIIQAFNRNN